jgi:hypothetical protein
MWYVLYSNSVIFESNTRCNKLEFQLKGVVYNVKNKFEHDFDEYDRYLELKRKRKFLFHDIFHKGILPKLTELHSLAVVKNHQN